MVGASVSSGSSASMALTLLAVVARAAFKSAGDTSPETRTTFPPWPTGV
jgi:hypothetical protein